MRRSFYHPELDALRFFAFFAVFLTHTIPFDPALYASHHIPSLLATFLIAVGKAGSFGVSLFFTLSSYLITSLLLREKEESGSVHLKSFYVRRILRIWPLYFFVLAVAALWPSVQGRLPGNYLLAFLLLAGNWMTVIAGPPASFASILWSVSIEEQFYLAWPLLVKRVFRDGILLTAIALIVVSNAVRLWLASRPLTEHSVFPNTFAQVDTIALGALLAITGVPRFGLMARLALASASLATLIACGHYFAATPAFTVLGYPLISLACAAMLASTIDVPVSARSVLVHLGKISYGLYAYHKMALLLVGLALGTAHTAPRFAVYWFGGLGLTIALSEASYKWLESPFLRLKERFTFVVSRPV